MKKLKEIENPWSHDVWSMGVVLLEIISGCQIDKSDSSFIQSRLEKSTITKGVFALPRLVLDNKEPCQNNEHIIEHDCSTIKKKFFVALDSAHYQFQDGMKRTLKQKDIYNFFEDKQLYNLVCQILQEDPK